MHLGEDLPPRASSIGRYIAVSKLVVVDRLAAACACVLFCWRCGRGRTMMALVIRWHTQLRREGEERKKKERITARSIQHEHAATGGRSNQPSWVAHCWHALSFSLVVVGLRFFTWLDSHAYIHMFTTDPLCLSLGELSVAHCLIARDGRPGLGVGVLVFRPSEVERSNVRMDIYMGCVLQIKWCRLIQSSKKGYREFGIWNWTLTSKIALNIGPVFMLIRLVVWVVQLPVVLTIEHKVFLTTLIVWCEWRFVHIGGRHLLIVRPSCVKYFLF